MAKRWVVSVWAGPEERVGYVSEVERRFSDDDEVVTDSVKCAFLAESQSFAYRFEDRNDAVQVANGLGKEFTVVIRRLTRPRTRH